MCGISSNLSSTINFRPSIHTIRTSHLVAKTLGSDNGDFIADSLVGLEVEGELWVVSLDDDLGGLFDGLRSNATHFDCGCVR
jgi:hypothetical protein